MNWQKTPNNKCCIPSQLSSTPSKCQKGKVGKERERVVQGDDEMHSTVILVQQYLCQKTPFGQKQLRKVSSAEGRWDVVFLAV